MLREGISVRCRLFTPQRRQCDSPPPGGTPLRRGGGRASREKRWVIYNGEPEASKVPPEWHAWLHHTVDEVPRPEARPRYPWEKEHQPNMTGTPFAYRPRGSVLRGGVRPPATGDYEPWTPE